MLMFVLLINLLLKAAKAFHQSDYEIIHHRLELITCNHNYFQYLRAELAPFNRTVRALNVSVDLLKNLTGPIPVTVQAFRRSMGDYKSFPLQLSLDYCKMRKENTFGINDLDKYSNASFCPMKKGHYYVNKYRPDETKFPPHVLPGDYKLALKISYASDTIAEFHWYGIFKQIDKLWK